LRGAVSSGFRAPSLQQLFFNNVSTQILGDEAVTVGTFTNDSPQVQALGVPSLVEEDSINTSIGFVANLTDRWDLTVDYYAIDIDDRIIFSNQLSADDDPTGGLGLALDAAGASAAQFFLNGADTETRGLDIVSTYGDIALGDGTLDITFAANFTDTDVTDLFVPSTGALSALAPEVVINEVDVSIIEQWQPEDRINLSARYTLDRWVFNLSFQRYGEYTVIEPGSDDLDGRTQTYGAELLTDVSVTYRLENGLRFFFSGNNIFDVTPDETTNTSSRGGQFESAPGEEDLASPTVFQFSRRAAPFGFNGSYFSLGIAYDF